LKPKNLIATGRQHQQPQSAPARKSTQPLIEADTTSPLSNRELLIKNLLDKEYSFTSWALAKGEVHQWMYDRYSLALL